MADTFTPIYNFRQIEDGASEDTWGDKTDANFLLVETELKAVSDVADAAAADAAAAETVATAAAALATAALPKSGGTMTGPIVLDADPAAAMQAATKQYVDAAVVPPATWRSIVGTSDTITSADNNFSLYCMSGSPTTITVNVCDVGTECIVMQVGGGQVTIVAGGGVTLYSNRLPAQLKSRTVGSIVTIVSLGATCFVGGDTAV